MMPTHIGDIIKQQTLPAPMVRPEENVPDRVDPTVLQLLHRCHDGWVNFTRKVAGKWEEAGAIKAAELRTLFADEWFQEFADQDSYFAIHGMFNHGKRRTKDTHPMLAPSLRNIASIRWLTAFHVDLDCYRLGMDKHAALAAVMRLVEAGRIPSPSLFTMSHGIWAIWILRDRLKPEDPVRCYPHEKVYDWWLRLQTGLHERCAEIGSDPATRHGATVTRIPGSISSNARFSRVGYMIPADINGNAFSYTLEEMDNFLNPARKTRTVEGRVDKKPDLVKQRGRIGRFSVLVKRLERLRNIRRGWKSGCRDNALLFVATGLKGMKATKEEVRAVLIEHLEDMEQPVGDRLTLSHAMRKWLNASFHHGGPSNQTVADALQVTPDEAAALSSIGTNPFPPARSQQGILPLRIEKASQKDKQAHRREEILKLFYLQIQAGCGSPSGHLMKQLLDGQGITTTVKTAIADMRALEIYEEKPEKVKPEPNRQRWLVEPE
jgi:hypothetical protein